MNLHNAKRDFIEKLHTYLVDHCSNTPKLAITMDCTGRVSDIVLYIHCTDDQWYIVAIDIGSHLQSVVVHKWFVISTLSEEENIPLDRISYFCLGDRDICTLNQFVESLKKYIY